MRLGWRVAKSEAGLGENCEVDHGNIPPAAVDESGVGALRRSWRQFCAGLDQAGMEVLSAAEDPLNAAEGIAQLGMLTEVALRWYLRGADPDHPRLIEINDTPEVADNLFAAVRGDAVYRLTGDVSTLFDLNISVHDSWAWLALSRPSGDLGLKDLQTDERGRFELIIGGAAREGNWLPLNGDAEFIQIREYHGDFGSHRPGQFEIVRIDPPAETASRLTPEQVAGKIDMALAWAQSYGPFHRASQAWTFPEAANSMHSPRTMQGGNSHIWYGFGRFALDPDQALILSFDKPDARLWSVQWLLDPWYENPDLLDRLTGIVGSEAAVNTDGRVRVIFSAQDPGVHNWLEVTDYPRGLFVTRWIWCDDGPPADLQVVPFAALRNHLPPDTEAITPGQRGEQRARRRTHLVHRRR